MLVVGKCGRGEQACRGSFTLGLDGHHTVELPAAASSANISEALRALPPFFSATQRTAVGSPADQAGRSCSVSTALLSYIFTNDSCGQSSGIICPTGRGKDLT